MGCPEDDGSESVEEKNRANDVRERDEVLHGCILP
jgi:hypothetical protein